jgi:hypothetical protein
VPARAGGYSPAWGARSPASGGSRLFSGSWPGGPAGAIPVGRAACGPLRLSSGLGHAAPCSPEKSYGSVIRAGARCAPFAGGVTVPPAGGRAAWTVATVIRAGARRALSAGGVFWDCRPGRGTLRPVHRRSHGAASWRPGRVGCCDCRPDRGTRCALFAGEVFRVCRPGGGTLRPVRRRSHCAARAAWAVATVVRAGADAPCSPERSSHRLTAVRPRGSRDCQPGGGSGAP